MRQPFAPYLLAALALGACAEGGRPRGPRRTVVDVGVSGRGPARSPGPPVAAAR